MLLGGHRTRHIPVTAADLSDLIAAHPDAPLVLARDAELHVGAVVFVAPREGVAVR